MYTFPILRVLRQVIWPASSRQPTRDSTWAMRHRRCGRVVPRCAAHAVSLLSDNAIYLALYPKLW